MIPRRIHYCWFGGHPLPELAMKCIESWHRFMPDYEYMLWNEQNFDINQFHYAKEAYDSGKYAFVSDVVRLKALHDFGGIYFDVDFEVYKSFDDLLSYKAFAGFEGSKSCPVMMGVIASEPGGVWVSEQLRHYQGRHFIIDGKPDLTTNVRYITDKMKENGFLTNGQEQDYQDLHVFPVEYFCPKLTTGEYRRTNNTHCEQKGSGSSWARKSIKDRLFGLLPSGWRIRLILLKRKYIG